MRFGGEDVKQGHQRDITRGSLAHNIWSLTWPITISQALFLLPGVYDVLWLGQLGPDAQPERASQSVTLITRAALLVSGCVLGLLAFFAPQIAESGSPWHWAGPRRRR